MSSMNTQIDYYLSVAILINKQLGGTRGYEAQANSKDKFGVVQNNIKQSFHFIKTKIEERTNKRSHEIMKINQDIKQKMDQTRRMIDRLRDILQNDNSPQATKDIKYQIIDKYQEQANTLQGLIDEAVQNSNAIKKGNQMLTVTDMKSTLLDYDGKKDYSHRVQSNKKRGKQQDPTQIQIQAMQRWKKTDQQIDQKIDDVTDRVIQWKKAVKQTGQLIDQSDAKIQQLTQDVDKVTNSLYKSNKQLKDIVAKFRKPHKFCLDIILGLILIGLIVGIIKVSTS